MSQLSQNSIRNIAIIAHVDHGKTTLVDHMLGQAGSFRAGQQVAERVMDNLDLERERGITIASKNCSVAWKGTKINIIDTPGHADFGGEVERGLKMVDGAILLVDAAEGPLPQTRFVLKKAFESDIKIIVVINKVDRKDARPQEVLDQVYSLFIDLDATDQQIEFPVLYAVGRDGWASPDLNQNDGTLAPLFDEIVKSIPAPKYDPAAPFQMLVTNLSYSDYLGRLALGRVMNGQAVKNKNLVCLGPDGKPHALKITSLKLYEGIRLIDVDEVVPGDIVVLSGIEDVLIGDTICTQDAPKALPRIHVDEPTVAMEFMINSSPFCGKEGKYVQSRRIFDRLMKETLYNVALRVEGGENSGQFLVKGRGELQMAVLIETMRREGFELAVGRPRVILKEIDGVTSEPIEHLFIDIEDSSMGIVTEKLAPRQGKMTNMVNHGTGRVRLEFSIPSRGLIGYRNEFLTDTRGTGVMSSYLLGYEPMRAEIKSRQTGSLVSDRMGQAIPYAIFGLEPRGRMFVLPGTAVYEGMVVGEHNRDTDLNVNICRTKKLTNIRAAGKDENVLLTPVKPMSLEKAIEYIGDDEQVEVTPLNIRIRKNVLSASMRK